MIEARFVPTMTRFCVKCRREIDDNRVAQGSFYRRNACRELDRRALGKGRLITSAAYVGSQSRREGERVALNPKIDSRADALGAHLALYKESDPVPVSNESRQSLKLQNEKIF